MGKVRGEIEAIKASQGCVRPVPRRGISTFRAGAPISESPYNFLVDNERQTDASPLAGEMHTPRVVSGAFNPLRVQATECTLRAANLDYFNSQ